MSIDSSDPGFESYREQAEAELWQALEALDEGDLPTVRSSCARVTRYTTDYWQDRRKNIAAKQDETNK